jgi:hypothetical protein
VAEGFHEKYVPAETVAAKSRMSTGSLLYHNVIAITYFFSASAHAEGVSREARIGFQITLPPGSDYVSVLPCAAFFLVLLYCRFSQAAQLILEHEEHAMVGRSWPCFNPGANGPSLNIDIEPMGTIQARTGACDRSGLW